MSIHLLDHQGRVVDHADRAFVESRLKSGESFWLDVQGPEDQDFAMFRETFRFHPLALEDSSEFGQRPKLEDYDHITYIVIYGAAPEPDQDRLVEVHCFYAESFLVTVRRDEAPASDLVRQRYARAAPHPVRPITVFYRLADALVDSFFPAIDELDDRLQTLESEILAGDKNANIQSVLALRRRLVALRRVITPQRDLIAELAAGSYELPGLDDEAKRYFRDVADHLVRATEQIDVERDLLTGALDVYLSSTSNRLNVTVTQLTLIATIFLPLSFITGYFGQNFRWLVDAIGSLGAFVVLGIGVQVVSVVVLLAFFRRRGWF
ncbi:MAG TPA: magnesium transporter CorA family protein [Gaiellaceae bacterium]|nr:magnesium transporter CorA family protein [Gaiellaceae bacterium]